MIYDFKCLECGRIAEDVVLPMTHSDDEHPRCCEQGMADYHTSPPTVLWKDGDLPDGAFTAGKRGEQVRIETRKQRREYMAENDLVDANDLGPPPNKRDQMEAFKDTQESIAAITPDAQEMEQLASSGLLDLAE